MSDQINKKFPLGYFLFALIPATLIGLIYLLHFMMGPMESMGPAMLASLLIGPAGILVTCYGFFRIHRGDDREYPALKWLVWLPMLVSVFGFLLG